MSHWWEYPISDVLPFSFAVYLRLLDSYAEAVWPLQILGFVLAGGIAWSMLRAPRARPVLLLVFLGGAWISVAWFFFVERYSTLFWAARPFAILFAIQGVILLLMVGAATTGRIALADRPRAAPALALFALAVVAYPVFAATALEIDGPPSEVFGLYPDPTAVATIAALAALRGGLRWIAVAIPVVWAIVQTAILLTLTAPTALLLPILSVIGLSLAILPRGRPTEPSSQSRRLGS